MRVALPVVAEEDGERAAGGPPLARELNWLRVLVRARRRARRHAGPEPWVVAPTGAGAASGRPSPAGRATIAMKKKRVQEEAEREREEEGWPPATVGTGRVVDGQSTPGRAGGGPRPPAISFSPLGDEAERATDRDREEERTYSFASAED